MTAFFVVQTFSRQPKGSLVSDAPIAVGSFEAAERMAARLSARRAGVLAYMKRKEDDDEPLLIAAFGTVPRFQVLNVCCIHP